MDTGFVTTTRLSHATPAALYAHSADRFWECDKKVPDDAPDGVHDVTWQLMKHEPGTNIKGYFITIFLCENVSQFLNFM